MYAVPNLDADQCKHLSIVAAGHELKHKAAMSKMRRGTMYTYINRMGNPQGVLGASVNYDARSMNLYSWRLYT